LSYLKQRIHSTLNHLQRARLQTNSGHAQRHNNTRLIYKYNFVSYGRGQRLAAWIRQSLVKTPT
jgi:hypothetical protein